MKLNIYWHWCIRYLALNTFISCLISILYMATPSTAPDNISAALFAFPYFIGHFGLLMFLLLSPVLVLGAILPFRAVMVTAGLYAAFLQVLLFVDTFVYQQYRFHINLFVLDLFFNGQGQIISFSWYLWSLVAAIILGLFAVQIWLAWFFSKRLSKVPLVRNTGKMISVWFICLLVSHLIHIFADGMFYRPITKIGFLPPFAVPANAQETLVKYGLVDVEKYKNQALVSFDQKAGGVVAYPLEEVSCKGPQDKLNVLFVVVDSLRYDHLSPVAMPRAHALSQKSILFEKHFSGSNSTRGGIFSFFYGLPPLYFEKFRESHVAPVIMNLFRQYDYQLGIYSSAPLTKPEFDQTVFAGIPDLRKKSKAQPAHLRDREITDEFINFVDQRDPQKPFFGFLFYDSAHEFDYDPAHIPFTPHLVDINYFALNNDTDPTLFLNRYKNSTHYIDLQIGRVIDHLEKQGLLENTIVVFSSDHGKEFNDNKLNYWGHNSNFTDAQTHVPFFIYWPGRNDHPKVTHWTSHYDIPATFAQELFQCKNKASAYSSGDNLFRHQGHDWILHGTYGDFGIRLPDHFIVIKNTGGYEILDPTYRPIEKPEIAIDAYQKALTEMRRFYK